MAEHADPRAADSPPHVLHVVESWPPVTSGYATRSEALIQAQDEAEYATPHVLVSSRQAMYGETDGRTDDPLKKRLSFVAPSQREQLGRCFRRFYVDGTHLEKAVREAARRWQVDLIHVHWPSGIGHAALRAARALGVPFVAEVRFDLAGAVMTETVRFPFPLLEDLLRRWFERHLLSANGLVAASYSLADFIRQRVPPKSPRVVVVPNGRAPGKFSPGPSPSALRRELELEGKLVVGSTSKMLRYEGLDLLLEAVGRLQNQSATDVHVLLVGAGPAKDQLQNQATSERLPVTFAGRVPHEEVVQYLRLMDLFAVPRRRASITRYASPVKVTEAMACGVPIIGSRLGDVSHMLADGRGVLVEPGSVEELADAIATLAEDADRRRSMGRRAYAWIEEQPSWAGASRRYDAVYKHAAQHFQSHGH